MYYFPFLSLGAEDRMGREKEGGGRKEGERKEGWGGQCCGAVISITNRDRERQGECGAMTSIEKGGGGRQWCGAVISIKKGWRKEGE